VRGFVDIYLAPVILAQQNYLEIYADLFEQFASSRALGSQVDAGFKYAHV